MKHCSKPYVETCVKCKGKFEPYVVKTDGLYYVRCGCGRWDRFQFLGLREEYAWEEWTKANRPIQRGRYNQKDDE